MRKKKILVHSNYCKLNTGFAKAKKNILKYLYASDKYEIVELANGFSLNDQSSFSVPWKCIGTLPANQAEVNQYQQDPAQAQALGYGAFTIDGIIKEEKPDVYIGVEDVWAFKGFEHKFWWGQVEPIIWTTLDSLPILEEAYDLERSTKNFFVWAKFAENAMKASGCANVKTLHGPVNLEDFKPLAKSEKETLRTRFGLTNEFVIGFVFRNQLRKSVPNLLKGFREFQKKNPKSKAKLLLHTHWQEGWNINKEMKEAGVDPSDVLTTYFCPSCSNYEISPYKGEQLDCPYCAAQGSMNTTNIRHGVNEEQLNEVYNIMDAYFHPFSSGGQEIPIQEAKLAGLVTAVTNYSCGEEYGTVESGGIPLSWDKYWEPGSQFIKATTRIPSIASAMEKVFKMKPEKRAEIGLRARDWVLNEFSVEKACKVLEEIIDNAPFVDEIKEESQQERNESYIPNDAWPDDLWVDNLLRHMLKRNFNHKHREGQKIMEDLRLSKSRERVLLKLKMMARKENEAMNNKGVSFDSLLDKTKQDRLAVVLPESEGDVFVATSLLTSIKKRYPEKDIYFITNPKYFPILEGNENIYKMIPYSPQIDNSSFLEGGAGFEGYFQIAYRPHVATQKDDLYVHNGSDTLDFQLT